MSWCAMARYRLGNWQAFLDDLRRVEDLLGDRRHKPPHFAYRPYAAAAVVHQIQGNGAAADSRLAIIAEIARAERTGRFTGAPWTSIVLARRGEYDEALKRLARALNAGISRQNRGELLEARAEVIAEAQLWGQASGVANDLRLHGNASKCLSLPITADRLEGLAAIAAERWDEARTDLALAEALIATSRTDEARAHLQKATATFERLEAVREGARASELLTRLG